jgi:formate hydrogenlyase transcriptional activator
MEHSSSVISDLHPAIINLVRSLEFVTPAPQMREADTSRDLQTLKLAIASSPSGIAFCDRSGRILLANQQLNTIFGYAANELLNRDFTSLVPDVVVESAPVAARRCAAPDAVRGADTTETVREVNGVRKDGSLVPIRVGVTQTWRHDGLFIASFIDLSERRSLEARLSREEHRVKFQASMADLAKRCAATTPDLIDATVNAVLLDIGEALDADRCVAYLPSGAHGAGFRVAYSWGRTGCRMPAADFDALKCLPWTMKHALDGQTVSVTTLDDVPDPVDRGSMAQFGTGSCAIVPMGMNGRRGALVVDAPGERTWPDDAIDALQLVAAVMGQALARKHDSDQHSSSVDALIRQRDHTRGENAVLRREMTAGQTDRTIASDSVAVRRALAQVQQVAPTTATVLLLGETGVGKEVFAQAIHNLSPRQRHSMIRVSCAAIPVALIESELFGRERGAFTGALSRQIGRFEAANGSTIFLDEIGDLPFEIQVKLLRVIQERTVERLGGNQSTKVDVRIIAATNRNLEAAVANNTFREDLFYRLNVFPITIPPLRERIEDIPGLVWTFIDEFSRAFGKRIDSIAKESLAALQRYSWPGNVRELRNVIEREMIIATGPTLVVAPPRPVSTQRRPASSKLVDIEVEHITSVLESCRWRVRGPGGAAERLGVKPTTLDSRMARLGIPRAKLPQA